MTKDILSIFKFHVIVWKPVLQLMEAQIKTLQEVLTLFCSFMYSINSSLVLFTASSTAFSLRFCSSIIAALTVSCLWEGGKNQGSMHCDIFVSILCKLKVLFNDLSSFCSKHIFKQE